MAEIFDAGSDDYNNKSLFKPKVIVLAK